jgi:hypothetical protein
MMVHVRLSGKSTTLPAEDLGIDRKTDDDEIRRIVARYCELGAGAAGRAVIDRNPDGIVVRPPAVFG